MSSLLIKNATIIGSSRVLVGDLLIRDGKIARVALSINSEAEQTIDGTGKYLFPGGIDVHTHMQLPVSDTTSSDSFETGTKAALLGGTTTIIDFANQTKGRSPLEAIGKWRSMADGNCYIDYGFHISITDLTDKIEEEIDQIIGEHGITSFKTFLAYPAMELSIEDLDQLMKIVAKKKGLITNHAEIGQILYDQMKKATDLTPRSHPICHPEVAETQAVRTLIDLAIKNRCPTYLVHTSTAKAAKMMAKAKRRFSKLFVETCPQYLTLTDELYSLPFEESTKYVMSPPLRSQKDRKGLWKQIEKSEVDVIATDHCPFMMDQKEAGRSDFKKIPNGAPGVEDRFILTYHQMINERKIGFIPFVNLIATNPAKIFGLYPKKGDIKVGFDADLVLVDPNGETTLSKDNHHMNVDYNLYEGKKIKGKIDQVISKGKLASQITKGDGDYLKRNLIS